MPFIEPLEQTQSYNLSLLDRQNIVLWLQDSFDNGLTDCDEGRNKMAVQLLEAMKREAK